MILPYQHSLKDLNLSDCNLLEGALPSDLSCLPSLESFALSRNSFITMPASLSRLPRLKKLVLAQCKSLQSLPELPSSIEILYADHCISLETFSYPSSAYKLKERGEFKFSFSNCFRLVENEHSDIMKAILLGIQHVASIPKALDPDNYYDAIVPGSSIPEWFIHQSMGSSVTVELPPQYTLA